MEYQGYRILSREKSYNYKFGSIEEQEKHSKTVLVLNNKTQIFYTVQASPVHHMSPQSWTTLKLEIFYAIAFVHQQLD